jgi:hypothetical protein
MSRTRGERGRSSVALIADALLRSCLRESSGGGGARCGLASAFGRCPRTGFISAPQYNLNPGEERAFDCGSGIRYAAAHTAHLHKPLPCLVLSPTSCRARLSPTAPNASAGLPTRHPAPAPSVLMYRIAGCT